MGIENFWKECARIDEKIWKATHNDKTIENIPTDSRALEWLKSDLETIATEIPMWDLERIWDQELSESIMSDKLRKEISMTKIFLNAAVRRNWGRAFEIVITGTQLSGIIGYGLSNRDLSELAKLYKEDKHRDKILELLEDCNFHTEYGDFQDGKCEEYISEKDIKNDEDYDRYLQILEIKIRLNSTLDEAIEMFENSVDDVDEEWTWIYIDEEELGFQEAESIGLEKWAEPYFDFKAFGKDVLNADPNLRRLESGRIAVRK